MKSKLRVLSIGLILFMMAFCGICHADENGNQDNLDFNLAPFYLWGINIDGDLYAGPATARVDISFDDIFDSLEAMFVVHV